MTGFTLYPAIDLKGGQCVRLIKGDMDQATVFSNAPEEQAKAFQDMGFDWVHIVDLDGAFAGESQNQASVSAILKAVSIPIQLGGGIRTQDHARTWLEAGVSRLILGTVAARDPGFVRELASEHPGKIAVGIDSINGKVAVEGWGETSDLDAIDLAKKYEDSGVCAIIATDIGRDGMKTGVNVDLTGALADAVSIPVIASGGVKSVGDITGLRERIGKRAVSGAILGRALYDGDIDPGDAIKAASC